MSILRILEILQSFSDSDHKLRQGDIIALLRIHYGMECERKAVARNIEFLQQAGYDIVNDGAGVYLADRKFEAGELRLLIDSVLTNRNICKAHTKELIGKLTEEGGKYFKNYAKHVVNLDDWQKDENCDYFYNIELCCEAIEQQKKLSFFYSYFDMKNRAEKLMKGSFAREWPKLVNVVKTLKELEPFIMSSREIEFLPVKQTGKGTVKAALFTADNGKRAVVAVAVDEGASGLISLPPDWNGEKSFHFAPGKIDTAFFRETKTTGE